MADAITIVKAPNEMLKDFNLRLLQTCQESEVTNVQLAIVDGQPVVTLFSEMVEADQEDVDSADEAGEKIALGDLIPSEEPVVVQVCAIKAGTDEAALKSQKRMGVLFERANGSVVSVLHTTGKGMIQVEDPATKKPVSVQGDVYFAAVIYNPSDDDAEEAEKAPAAE